MTQRLLRNPAFRTASQEEIKTAFRQLARQYHPDVSQDPQAEDKFKEVNEAYGVLSDPEKRATYDRLGRGLGDMNGMPDFTVDFADLFRNFLDLLVCPKGQRNMPRKGADLNIPVTLTFEESIFGVEKEISFTRDEVCHSCRSSGAEPGTSPTRCATCGGRGKSARCARPSLVPWCR